MLRKPCAVIWSLEYPSLRSAPLSVVSLSGRPPPRIAGNTQRPLPVMGRSSRIFRIL